MSAGEYRERLERGVCADLRELGDPAWRLPRALVEPIASRQLEALDRDAALFDERVRLGRIVEGHGDLRPEHVYLEPKPVVIDCLEFDRDLRLLDPIDELAFLALECERLGAAEIGASLLRGYTRSSGDRPDPKLVRFYRHYRAYRRARIAVWRLRDPAADTDRWRRRALYYLNIATGER